jgi:cell volume regulation protein A
MQQIILTDSSGAVGKLIVELSVPSTVNILSIKRGDVYIAPNGSTRLLANDILYVLAEDVGSIVQLNQALDIN